MPDARRVGVALIALSACVHLLPLSHPWPARLLELAGLLLLAAATEHPRRVGLAALAVGASFLSVEFGYLGMFPAPVMAFSAASVLKVGAHLVVLHSLSRGNVALVGMGLYALVNAALAACTTALFFYASYGGTGIDILEAVGHLLLAALWLHQLLLRQPSTYRWEVLVGYGLSVRMLMLAGIWLLAMRDTYPHWSQASSHFALVTVEADLALGAVVLGGLISRLREVADARISAALTCLLGASLLRLTWTSSLQGFEVLALSGAATLFGLSLLRFQHRGRLVWLAIAAQAVIFPFLLVLLTGGLNGVIRGLRLQSAAQMWLLSLIGPVLAVVWVSLSTSWILWLDVGLASPHNDSKSGDLVRHPPVSGVHR